MNFKYLYVSHYTFNEYYNKFKNNRLSKFIKITTSKYINENPLIKLNEIFDKDYSDVKYNVVYSDDDITTLKFETNKNKYRLDLLKMKNYCKEIEDDFVYNISFTELNRDVDEYEMLTNKKEIYEILGKIGYILKDFNKCKNHSYLIGLSNDERKNKLYDYFLRIVFNNYKIRYDYCEGFVNNMGIYILK